MPRDGSYHYLVPVGTDGVADQTIDSGRYNAFVHDVELDLNTPRPISAGGTGANNATDALTNMGGETRNQLVTNYDVYPFVSGSFYSGPGATAAPNATDFFEGICYATNGSIPDFYIEARSLATDIKYYRRKGAVSWSGWTRDDHLAIDLASTKVAKAGDTMTGSLVITGTGDLTIGKTLPTLYLSKAGGGDACQIVGQTAGSNRWLIQLGDLTPETGATDGSLFKIVRFDNVGNPNDAPIVINRTDGRVTLIGNPITALHAATKAYADTKVAKAGDTMTGGLTISMPAWPGIVLNKADASSGNYLQGNVGGLGRWAIYLGDTVAESGGNSGSGFLIYRFNDAGGLIDAPFYITRNDGAVHLAATPTAPDHAVRKDYVDGTTAAGLAGKVSKAGDTMSGPLTAAGTIQSNAGFVQSQAAGAGNAYFRCLDSAGNPRGGMFWDASTDSMVMNGATSAVRLSSAGVVDTGVGTHGRAGQAGAYDGNVHNFFWTGTANQMWIDGTNFGTVNVTCDYRTKKDVVPLASTWAVVKLLNPIVYTHAEFTPPAAIDAAEARGEDAVPLFVDDDEPHWGFLAHELQDTLLPSAAHGYKDSPTDVQTPNTLAIIAALTRCLQEAMTRIEALEARAGATYATSR